MGEKITSIESPVYKRVWKNHELEEIDSLLPKGGLDTLEKPFTREIQKLQ